MSMPKRTVLKLALGLMAGVVLPQFGYAASNIPADLPHPLWYQAPSAKTMELAKIDDLSNTVVSDGQRGEIRPRDRRQIRKARLPRPPRDDTREFQRPNLFITGEPEARAG